MKSFFILQAWSLVFMFASTITAVPVDPSDERLKRENACIAGVKCPRQDSSASSLATATPEPPPNPAPAKAIDPLLKGMSSATSSTPDPTVSVQRVAMTPYLYKCSKDQKAKVQEAWTEAGQLADAHAKWQPPGWFSSGSYQPAMSMYLGTDSAKDNPWFGTGPLRKNILRQQGIHTTNDDWSPSWSYVYIYCDESQVPQKGDKPKKPQCNNPSSNLKVGAYTFSDDSSILWNAKYIVLCPRFFESEILSLSEQVAAAKKDTSLQKVIDPWRRIRARSMFHETYHWGPDEVSDPICDLLPEVYAPAQVVDLASEKNVAGSRINAESWAQAAMAIYIQQTFKLKDPPAPKSKLPLDLDTLLTDDKSSDDSMEELFFDKPPDWFLPPVATDAPTFSPNMTDVEQLTVP